MDYRRCGRSGLKLPALSLGLWHNFGANDDFANARDMIEASRQVSAGIAGVDDVDVELLNTVYRYVPAVGPLAA